MQSSDRQAAREPYVRNIERQVRAGATPDDAARQLLEVVPGNEAAVKLALAEYLRRVGAIRIMRDPPGMVDGGVREWYLGPADDDRFWPRLKVALRGRLTNEAVDVIDQASTKVVCLLPSPGLTAFHSRGLVLGYVQSGKTANYTAVVAKAADVNYRFFIVLSGVHNTLRSQTQERLERELCDLNAEDWASLTTVTDDFRLRAAGNADFFLTGHRDQRVLVVVKKNAVVLRRLIRWLKSASPRVLASCPVLVVDDEADQASVNASTSPGGRTRVNELILELLSVPPRAAYVGYTATPFANLLIDPVDASDLYPRDFIVDLPRPQDYFGPERLFGRDRLTQEDGDEIDGLDMIRHIPDTDVPLVKPPSRNRGAWAPALPESLRMALDYFLVAATARHARGEESPYSSMLIHTSMYIDAHQALSEMVRTWVADRERLLRSADAALTARLSDIWRDETLRVPAAELGERSVDFDELRPLLHAVAGDIEVVVENSRSPTRLEYGGVGHPMVIIGGNTLSRGLTLKGLMVSYFVRTASAYDTLLQMGRWFGYREGYADLSRVWMTDELAGYFFDLATVEHEIREDIRLYELEGTTPTDFAVRIRTHPVLTITARAKMQRALDCDISYSGRRPQMIFYRHRDGAWLRRNLTAGRQLIARAAREHAEHTFRADRSSHVFEGMSSDAVLEFVAAYAFHPRNDYLQAELLAGYIRDQVAIGELAIWNLAVVGRRLRPEERTLDLGEGLSVPLLNRAKLRENSTPTDAYLKAIMSHADLGVDLDMSVETLAAQNSAQLIDARRRGLVLLYPIDRDSTPRRADGARPSSRLALEAVEDLLGVAFVFPRASSMTPQGYKMADLSHIVREPLDLPEETDQEDEDS